MDLSAVIENLRDQIGIRVEFTAVLLMFALLMSRILPVIILTPALGGEVVPTEVKLGIGLTLGLVLFPALQERIQYIPLTALPFIALMVKELFIGLAMSLIVGRVFEAAQSAGTLIDTMAGTNQAQLLVPQLQQNVSLFSALKLQLTVALFLTLNGHHLVIEGFSDSLVAIPLDRFPGMHAGAWPFFDLIIRVFGDMIRVAVAISAPVFITAFLVDLAMGMINRVAPQMHVFFVAMQIKPLATVLMMFLVVHLLLDRIAQEFGGMRGLLHQAIRLLS